MDIRQILWHVVLGILVVGTLGAGLWLGAPLIQNAQSPKEALQAVVALLSLPVVLYLGAFEKISKEALTTMLGVIIGFAFGKIG
jgi:hypothetical protein